MFRKEMYVYTGLHHDQRRGYMGKRVGGQEIHKESCILQSKSKSQVSIFIILLISVLLLPALPPFPSINPSFPLAPSSVQLLCPSIDHISPSIYTMRFANFIITLGSVASVAGKVPDIDDR